MQMCLAKAICAPLMPRMLFWCVLVCTLCDATDISVLISRPPNYFFPYLIPLCPTVLSCSLFFSECFRFVLSHVRLPCEHDSNYRGSVKVRERIKPIENGNGVLGTAKLRRCMPAVKIVIYGVNLWLLYHSPYVHQMLDHWVRKGYDLRSPAAAT